MLTAPGTVSQDVSQKGAVAAGGGSWRGTPAPWAPWCGAGGAPAALTATWSSPRRPPRDAPRPPSGMTASWVKVQPSEVRVQVVSEVRWRN